MRRIKNLLCLALALCMLLPGLPAAFGEEPGEASSEDSFGI